MLIGFKKEYKENIILSKISWQNSFGGAGADQTFPLPSISSKMHYIPTTWIMFDWKFARTRTNKLLPAA